MGSSSYERQRYSNLLYKIAWCAATYHIWISRDYLIQAADSLVNSNTFSLDFSTNVLHKMQNIVEMSLTASQCI